MEVVGDLWCVFLCVAHQCIDDHWEEGNTSQGFIKVALVKGCEDHVMLRPMRVIRIIETYSDTVPSNLGFKGHANDKHNWLEKGLAVLNTEGGKGVDVFFALKKRYKSGYVVFTG